MHFDIRRFRKKEMKTEDDRIDTGLNIFFCGWMVSETLKEIKVFKRIIRKRNKYEDYEHKFYYLFESFNGFKVEKAGAAQW